MKPKDKGGTLIWLLLVAAFLLAAPHSHAQSNYPSWWSNYGVLSGTTPNDYAASNQGQAKNVAYKAIQELDNDLAQFGGSGLDGLAVILTATSAQTNDYAGINLGQLKALSAPFFDRLLALGYNEGPLTSGDYPWIGGTANDYALGNIGQLKFLFSFDVMHSSDGSGIPDWWEKEFFPGQTVNPTGVAGNGLTNLENYLDGVNPNVQLEVNVFVQ